MKLKYIFTAVIAAMTTMFTACNDDQDLAPLDNIQVSKSMAILPVEGGSDTVTVKGYYKNYVVVDASDAAIALDDKTYPTWLEVKEEIVKNKDGQALPNTYNLIFKAAATTTPRTARLCVTVDGQTQHLMVVQGVQGEVSLSTCAQVIAGADGSTYRVKGKVTKIANTTYGNWYLNDGTGEIYIYGTLDASGGSKNFASLNIEMGDEVTVEGPKTTYGTTVELVDVSVVNITKSIVKVDSLSTSELAKEGGEVIAYLTNKGDGLDVNIPEEAEDWLSIKSITNSNGQTLVTFRANANAGGARSAEVSFTSGTSTVVATINQAGSIMEATVSEFLAAAEGTALYRLTGVITKVDKAQYGNVYIRDYTGEAYIYGIGQSGDFEKLGLKVGDIVTLTGQRSSYMQNPQMKGGTYESHISVEKISAAEFVKLSDSKEKYYMITGKIANASNGNKTDLNTYGNFDIVDESGAVYVYGLQTGWENTPNNSRKHFSDLGKGLDDEITVIGYKSSYNGKPQMGGAFYFEEKN